MANKALSFDGTDDYVTVPDHASMDWTTKVSAFAWVKPSNVGGDPQVIVSKIQFSPNNREWSFELLNTPNNGTLRVGFGDPNDGTYEGIWRTTAGVLANDTWALVGFTYDAGTVIIYVNGSAVGSELADGAIPASLYNGTADLVIGSNHPHTADFAGIIDEVIVTDDVISAAEVTAIWNGGSGIPWEADANTVALWHMNEGADSTIYDETTNDNDGTIDGASWVDGYDFIVLPTPKTSSDTGQGAEALLNRAYILPEVGVGSESLGSRLMGAIEEGGGVETLLARLMASTETASGVDAGGLFFTSGDAGSGLDAILALEARLTGADSGSGIDTAYLIKILLSTDSGLGAEAVAALLARIVTGELMVGSDCLVVKIESAPKGEDMRLPPGGKTSIPSRRVNL